MNRRNALQGSRIACPSSARRRVSTTLLAVSLLLSFVSPCAAAGPPAKGSQGKSGGATTAPGAAGPPTATLPIAATFVCYADLVEPMDPLLRQYEKGDWSGLQETLQNIVTALQRKDQNGSSVCKPGLALPANARLSFAFIDDAAPQPTVVRVLEGGSPAPDIWSQRTIGPNPLFTIYLYRHDAMTPILTTYTASPTPSPVQTGVTQLVSNVGGSLKLGPATATASAATRAQQTEAELAQDINAEFAEATTDSKNNLLAEVLSDQFAEATTQKIENLSKALAEIGGPGHKSPTAWTLRCYVTKATIPQDLSWAQLTVTDNANIQQLLDKKATESRVTARIQKSQPLVALNNKLIAVLGKDPCADATTPDKVTKCQTAVDETFNAATATLIDPSDIDSAMTIYGIYSGMLNTTPQASLQTTYIYAPLTRWSFGAYAGAVAHTNLHQQVKVANGSLVGDPPTALLTGANAYWSPWGYDETTLKARPRELPRAFVGVVFTPNPGLALGAAIALPGVRNLTINAGYAVMLAPVLPKGKHVGDSATTAKRGSLGAWTIALGYSF